MPSSAKAAPSTDSEVKDCSASLRRSDSFVYCYCHHTTTTPTLNPNPVFFNTTHMLPPPFTTGFEKCRVCFVFLVCV